MKKRLISILLIVSFVVTSLYPPSGYGAVQQPVSASHHAQFPAEFNQLKLPPEMGQIQEAFKGKPGHPSVVLIRDAHAIPDAQRNIQKIIQYLQSEYGIKNVALEGAASVLDAQIFKSFPDQEKLRKVMDEYMERAELTGGNAAAIFGAVGSSKLDVGREKNNRLSQSSNLQPLTSNFQGIEDWDLYEQGVGLYLKATQEEATLLAALRATSEELRAEKEKVYTKEQLELDEAVEKFYENEKSLPELLTLLMKYQRPEQGSELSVLAEEVLRGQSGKDDFEKELREAAQMLQKKIQTPEVLREFNGKFQAYQTSMLSAEAFGGYLKKVAENEKIEIRLSDSLLRGVSHHERLRDVEGTKLMEEMEEYLEDVQRTKYGVLREEQKTDSAVRSTHDALPSTLYERTKELRLLKKLAKLELSSEDWGKIKAAGEDFSEWISPEELRAQEAFYKNSERREEAMFANLEKQFEAPKVHAAILVAGGFHTQGMSRILKEKGYSVVTVMPKIGTMPEHSLYREHMQGKVSWSKYFEVENGKVSPYKAFVRATRDRLLEHQNTRAPEHQSTRAPGERINQTGDLVTGALVRSDLKPWRDQLIRDLASQHRIEDAGRYTYFLDELTAEKSLPVSVQQGLRRVDRFIEGLRGLEASHAVTSENVFRLFKAGMIPDVYTYSALSGDFVRKENRSNFEDVFRGYADGEIRFDPGHELNCEITGEESPYPLFKKNLLRLPYETKTQLLSNISHDDQHPGNQVAWREKVTMVLDFLAQKNISIPRGLAPFQSREEELTVDAFIRFRPDLAPEIPLFDVIGNTLRSEKRSGIQRFFEKGWEFCLWLLALGFYAIGFSWGVMLWSLAGYVMNMKLRALLPYLYKLSQYLIIENAWNAVIAKFQNKLKTELNYSDVYSVIVKIIQDFLIPRDQLFFDEDDVMLAEPHLSPLAAYLLTFSNLLQKEITCEEVVRLYQYFLERMSESANISADEPVEELAVVLGVLGQLAFSKKVQADGGVVPKEVENRYEQLARLTAGSDDKVKTKIRNDNIPEMMVLIQTAFPQLTDNEIINRFLEIQSNEQHLDGPISAMILTAASFVLPLPENEQVSWVHFLFNKGKGKYALEALLVLAACILARSKLAPLQTSMQKRLSGEMEVVKRSEMKAGQGRNDTAVALFHTEARNEIPDETIHAILVRQEKRVMERGENLPPAAGRFDSLRGLNRVDSGSSTAAWDQYRNLERLALDQSPAWNARTQTGNAKNNLPQKPDATDRFVLSLDALLRKKTEVFRKLDPKAGPLVMPELDKGDVGVAEIADELLKKTGLFYFHHFKEYYSMFILWLLKHGYTVAWIRSIRGILYSDYPEIRSDYGGILLASKTPSPLFHRLAGLGVPVFQMASNSQGVREEARNIKDIRGETSGTRQGLDGCTRRNESRPESDSNEMLNEMAGNILGSPFSRRSFMRSMISAGMGVMAQPRLPVFPAVEKPLAHEIVQEIASRTKHLEIFISKVIEKGIALSIQRLGHPQSEIAEEAYFRLRDPNRSEPSRTNSWSDFEKERLSVWVKSQVQATRYVMNLIRSPKTLGQYCYLGRNPETGELKLWPYSFCVNNIDHLLPPIRQEIMEEAEQVLNKLLSETDRIKTLSAETIHALDESDLVFEEFKRIFNALTSEAPELIAQQIQFVERTLKNIQDDASELWEALLESVWSQYQYPDAKEWFGGETVSLEKKLETLKKHKEAFNRILHDLKQRYEKQKNAPPHLEFESPTESDNPLVRCLRKILNNPSPLITLEEARGLVDNHFSHHIDCGKVTRFLPKKDRNQFIKEFEWFTKFERRYQCFCPNERRRISKKGSLIGNVTKRTEARLISDTTRRRARGKGYQSAGDRGQVKQRTAKDEIYEMARDAVGRILGNEAHSKTWIIRMAEAIFGSSLDQAAEEMAVAIGENPAFCDALYKAVHDLKKEPMAGDEASMEALTLKLILKVYSILETRSFRRKFLKGAAAVAAMVATGGPAAPLNSAAGLSPAQTIIQSVAGQTNGMGDFCRTVVQRGVEHAMSIMGFSDPVLSTRMSAALSAILPQKIAGLKPLNERLRVWELVQSSSHDGLLDLLTGHDTTGSFLVRDPKTGELNIFGSPDLDSMLPQVRADFLKTVETKVDAALFHTESLNEFSDETIHALLGMDLKGRRFSEVFHALISDDREQIARQIRFQEEALKEIREEKARLEKALLQSVENRYKYPDAVEWFGGESVSLEKKLEALKKREEAFNRILHDLETRQQRVLEETNEPLRENPDQPSVSDRFKRFMFGETPAAITLQDAEGLLKDGHSAAELLAAHVPDYLPKNQQDAFRDRLLQLVQSKENERAARASANKGSSALVRQEKRVMERGESPVPAAGRFNPLSAVNRVNPGSSTAAWDQYRNLERLALDQSPELNERTQVGQKKKNLPKKLGATDRFVLSLDALLREKAEVFRKLDPKADALDDTLIRELIQDVTSLSPRGRDILIRTAAFHGYLMSDDLKHLAMEAQKVLVEKLYKATQPEEILIHTAAGQILKAGRDPFAPPGSRYFETFVRNLPEWLRVLEEKKILNRSEVPEFLDEIALILKMMAVLEIHASAKQHLTRAGVDAVTQKIKESLEPVRKRWVKKTLSHEPRTERFSPLNEVTKTPLNGKQSIRKKEFPAKQSLRAPPKKKSWLKRSAFALIVFGVMALAWSAAAWWKFTSYQLRLEEYAYLFLNRQNALNEEVKSDSGPVYQHLTWQGKQVDLVLGDLDSRESVLRILDLSDGMYWNPDRSVIIRDGETRPGGQQPADRMTVSRMGADLGIPVENPVPDPGEAKILTEVQLRTGLDREEVLAACLYPQLVKFLGFRSRFSAARGLKPNYETSLKKFLEVCERQYHLPQDDLTEILARKNQELAASRATLIKFYHTMALVQKAMTDARNDEGNRRMEELVRQYPDREHFLVNIDPGHQGILGPAFETQDLQRYDRLPELPDYSRVVTVLKQLLPSVSPMSKEPVHEVIFQGSVPSGKPQNNIAGLTGRASRKETRQHFQNSHLRTEVRSVEKTEKEDREMQFRRVLAQILDTEAFKKRSDNDWAVLHRKFFQAMIDDLKPNAPVSLERVSRLLVLRNLAGIFIAKSNPYDIESIQQGGNDKEKKQLDIEVDNQYQMHVSYSREGVRKLGYHPKYKLIVIASSVDEILESMKADQESNLPWHSIHKPEPRSDLASPEFFEVVRKHLQYILFKEGNRDYPELDPEFLPKDPAEPFDPRALIAALYAGMTPGTRVYPEMADQFRELQSVKLIPQEGPGTVPALLFHFEVPFFDGVDDHKTRDFAMALLKEPFSDPVWEASIEHELAKVETHQTELESLVFSEADSLDLKAEKMKRLFELALQGKLLVRSRYSCYTDEAARRYAELVGRTESEKKAIARTMILRLEMVRQSEKGKEIHGRKKTSPETGQKIRNKFETWSGHAALLIQLGLGSLKLTELLESKLTSLSQPKNEWLIHSRSFSSLLFLILGQDENNEPVLPSVDYKDLMARVSYFGDVLSSVDDAIQEKVNDFTEVRDQKIFEFLVVRSVLESAAGPKAKKPLKDFDFEGTVKIIADRIQGSDETDLLGAVEELKTRLQSELPVIQLQNQQDFKKKMAMMHGWIRFGQAVKGKTPEEVLRTGLTLDPVLRKWVDQGLQYFGDLFVDSLIRKEIGKDEAALNAYAEELEDAQTLVQPWPLLMTRLGERIKEVKNSIKTPQQKEAESIQGEFAFELEKNENRQIRAFLMAVASRKVFEGADRLKNWIQSRKQKSGLTPFYQRVEALLDTIRSETRNRTRNSSRSEVRDIKEALDQIHQAGLQGTLSEEVIHKMAIRPGGMNQLKVILDHVPWLKYLANFEEVGPELLKNIFLIHSMEMAEILEELPVNQSVEALVHSKFPDRIKELLNQLRGPLDDFPRYWPAYLRVVIGLLLMNESRQKKLAGYAGGPGIELQKLVQDLKDKIYIAVPDSAALNAAQGFVDALDLGRVQDLNIHYSRALAWERILAAFPNLSCTADESLTLAYKWWGGWTLNFRDEDAYGSGQDMQMVLSLEIYKSAPYFKNMESFIRRNGQSAIQNQRIVVPVLASGLFHENKMVLELFKGLANEKSHPFTFVLTQYGGSVDQLEETIKSQGLRCAVRKFINDPWPNTADLDVLILATQGEMNRVYQHADVIFSGDRNAAEGIGLPVIFRSGEDAVVHNETLKDLLIRSGAAQVAGSSEELKSLILDMYAAKDTFPDKWRTAQNEFQDKILGFHHRLSSLYMGVNLLGDAPRSELKQTVEFHENPNSKIMRHLMGRQERRQKGVREGTRVPSRKRAAETRSHPSSVEGFDFKQFFDKGHSVYALPNHPEKKFVFRLKLGPTKSRPKYAVQGRVKKKTGVIIEVFDISGPNPEYVGRTHRIIVYMQSGMTFQTEAEHGLIQVFNKPFSDEKFLQAIKSEWDVDMSEILAKKDLEYDLRPYIIGEIRPAILIKTAYQNRMLLPLDSKGYSGMGTMLTQLSNQVGLDLGASEYVFDGRNIDFNQKMGARTLSKPRHIEDERVMAIDLAESLKKRAPGIRWNSELSLEETRTALKKIYGRRFGKYLELVIRGLHGYDWRNAFEYLMKQLKIMLSQDSPENRGEIQAVKKLGFLGEPFHEKLLAALTIFVREEFEEFKKTWFGKFTVDGSLMSEAPSLADRWIDAWIAGLFHADEAETGEELASMIRASMDNKPSGAPSVIHGLHPVHRAETREEKADYTDLADEIPPQPGPAPHIFKRSLFHDVFRHALKPEIRRRIRAKTVHDYSGSMIWSFERAPYAGFMDSLQRIQDPSLIRELVKWSSLPWMFHSVRWYQYRTDHVLTLLASLEIAIPKNLFSASMKALGPGVFSFVIKDIPLLRMVHQTLTKRIPAWKRVPGVQWSKGPRALGEFYDALISLPDGENKKRLLEYSKLLFMSSDMEPCDDRIRRALRILKSEGIAVPERLASSDVMEFRLLRDSDGANLLAIPLLDFIYQSLRDQDFPYGVARGLDIKAHRKAFRSFAKKIRGIQSEKTRKRLAKLSKTLWLQSEQRYQKQLNEIISIFQDQGVVVPESLEKAGVRELLYGGLRAPLLVFVRNVLQEDSRSELRQDLSDEQKQRRNDYPASESAHQAFDQFIQLGDDWQEQLRSIVQDLSEEELRDLILIVTGEKPFDGKVRTFLGRILNEKIEASRKETRLMAAEVFAALMNTRTSESVYAKLSEDVAETEHLKLVIAELKQLRNEALRDARVFKQEGESQLSFGAEAFANEVQSLIDRLRNISGGYALAFIIPEQADKASINRSADQIIRMGFKQVVLEGRDHYGLTQRFKTAGIYVSSPGLQRTPVFLSDQKEAGLVAWNSGDVKVFSRASVYVPVTIDGVENIQNPFVRDYAFVLQAATALLIAREGKAALLKHPVSILERFGLIDSRYQNAMLHAADGRITFSGSAIENYLNWKAEQKSLVSA